MEERKTLEKIAPSIEEAIQEGLDELGLRREDVRVETLDEGSKGVLGIGSRHARVLLTVKTEADKQAALADKGTPSPQAAPESHYTKDVDNLIAITEATVAELLEKMQVFAKVEVRLNEEDSTEEFPSLNVDISGNDLSILIGKRAETLNALQYITRLIVGKEIGHGTRIKMDVEGYRSRRESNLAQLAEQMAKQAVKTGRRQSLEPMPANERRMIHIALRDNQEVITESVGEEPRRKVVIIPVE